MRARLVGLDFLPPANGRATMATRRRCIGQAILACWCMIAGSGASPASILQLPSIWSDGAVVQQQRPVRIWGRSRPDAEVVVVLANEADDSDREVASTTADAHGEWRVVLEGREAGFARYGLHVRSGDESLDVTDLLFGEVWLSGGQSNMALQLQFVCGADMLLATANRPALRIFHQATATAEMRTNASRAPLFDVAEGRWLAATSGENVRQCSGIAYAFALAVYESLNVRGRQVPVAVINTAVGSSSIAAWISPETTDSVPELKANYPQAWRAGPELKGYQSSFFQSTALFNHKVAPLAPFGVRGFIWLQGESDAGKGEPGAGFYRIAMDALIRDWRRAFDQDDLPFFFLLLHPYAHRVKRSQPQHLDSLAFFREAQLDVAREVPHTAAFPIHDVPLTWQEPGNRFAYRSPIHPLDKTPVGERLARAARALVYGESVECFGPVCERAERDGHEMRLTFSRCPGGLTTRDRHTELRGFTVCGVDRVFVPAHAVIVGRDRLTVWASAVPEPVAVAYGFTAMNQEANLVNAAGLPAPPFRTDRVASTFVPVFPDQQYRTEDD